MAILNQVHRGFPLILFSGLGYAIHSHRLLQDAIAAVFFILQDAKYHLLTEVQFLSWDFYLLCFQDIGYPFRSHSCQEHVKDPFHDSRFFRNDLRRTVRPFFVTQELFVNVYALAIFKVFAVAPGDVFAHALRLGLSESCIDDKIQFTITFESIYVLFFEVDADPSGFQLSDVIQAVHRISCEAGDRFRYDVIDLSGEAVIDHSLELRSFICAGSGDAFIRIDSDQFPFLVGHNHVRVDTFLGVV